MRGVPLSKNRVMDFLSELKTRSDGGFKTSIVNLAQRMGLGCASAFSKALIKNGHVKRLEGGSGGTKYECKYAVTDNFANHVITLVRDIKQSWKNDKYTAKKEKKSLTPLTPNLLSRFTDRQITNELKSRGFTGKIKMIKTTEIEF